jgi:hypothetical protein
MVAPSLNEELAEVRFDIESVPTAWKSTGHCSYSPSLYLASTLFALNFLGDGLDPKPAKH